MLNKEQMNRTCLSLLLLEIFKFEIIDIDYASPVIKKYQKQFVSQIRIFYLNLNLF